MTCTYTYNDGSQCGHKPAHKHEGVTGELDWLCSEHYEVVKAEIRGLQC